MIKFIKQKIVNKKDKKWFRCPVEKAINVIKSFVGLKTLYETFNPKEEKLEIRGWVYVITNKSFSKDRLFNKGPERRAIDLNHPGYHIRIL